VDLASPILLGRDGARNGLRSLQPTVHYSLVGRRGEVGDAAGRGWYPDTDPTRQRWWDGRQWSTLTRPDPGPPDARGRRLRTAGFALLIAGVIGSWVAYPFIGGDPGPGEPKEVPGWAVAFAGVPVVAIGLSVVAFVARWFVRRRS